MKRYMILIATLVVAAILLTACNTGSGSADGNSMPNSGEVDTGSTRDGESLPPADDVEGETSSDEESMPPDEGATFLKGGVRCLVLSAPTAGISSCRVS